MIVFSNSQSTRRSGSPARLAIFSLLVCELFSGCSTSSGLVKPDDSIYNEAQGRLERTISLVNTSKASAAERAMFVQAESFYRYRFEPAAQTTASFLAQAVASATDFPVFQSLSGSLDLLDLRVRASDSAIQTWETFLTRYPQSDLKPLTLYRLGWAYRNAGVQGLPRSEPNEAFDKLIQEYPSSPYANLSQEAKNVPWKSKSSAATRSLVPGLGQLYVGETGSGIARMSIAIVAAAAAVIPLFVAAHRSSELNWSHDWPLLASSVGGFIVLSFDYTSSYNDAMRGVVQWNERQEMNFNAGHPSAP